MDFPALLSGGLLTQYPIVVIARTVVGVVLLTASIPKLVALDKFVELVQGYRILPTSLGRLLGSILPASELFVGIGVFLGILMPWAGLLAAFLFVVFVTGIAINLVRGRWYIPCGCFGSHSDSTISWTGAIRSATLAGLSLITTPLYPTWSQRGTLSAVLIGLGSISLWWLTAIVRDLFLYPGRDAYFPRNSSQQVNSQAELQ